LFDPSTGSDQNHPPTPEKRDTAALDFLLADETTSEQALPISPIIKIEDDSASESDIRRLTSIPNPTEAPKTRRRRRHGKGKTSAEGASRRGRKLRATLPVSLEENLYSNSNYLNILNGTMGGIYPSHFTAKVQAKRISHKISEKARRDRLGRAINELYCLMPEGWCVPAGRDEEEGGDKVESPVFSKALVVESAVRYIRSLRAQLKGRLEDLPESEDIELDSTETHDFEWIETDGYSAGGEMAGSG
jgi:hypothetical protein